MNIKELINEYIKNGYGVLEAEAKVCQDIVLLLISSSKLSHNITIKGGVVIHSISNDLRRATRDMDLDFIKYSLEDKSIIKFIEILNSINNEIKIEIKGVIKKLNHQDYDGKRVNIILQDKNGNKLKTKLDIGVHKQFNIEQDDYCFDLSIINKNVNLLVNSKEQIILEKIKSLLRLGFRSTRYKDLFDIYYLINNTQVDYKKLKEYFNIIIFEDEKMREKNYIDVINRLKMIFNSNTYINNLKDPKNNWLEISVQEVINCILNFIVKLSEIDENIKNKINV